MPNLWCTAISGDDSDVNNTKDMTTIVRRSLQPEEGKKSSFLFEPDLPLTIPKPAHLIIDFSTHTSPGDSAQIFFLGGFQAVTNAKHLEVYITDKNGKEEYLMTSKGIPFQKGTNGEEWQKAVCVIPGGPRPILRIHIKLLSLKPTGETTTAQVKTMKLTARLPDTPAPSSIPQTSSSHNHKLAEDGPKSNTTTRIQSNDSNAPSPTGVTNGITQADLGAAMASFSIMARSTEDGIEKVITEKMDRFENFLQTRLYTLEQHVSSLTVVTASQRATLEGQTKLLEIQQSMMNAQTEQIKCLLDQQQRMSQMVKDLQVEIHLLRHEDRKQEDQTKTKTVDSRMSQKTSPPLAIEEELVEGGIEHTLSNLDLGGDEDDQESDNDGNHDDDNDINNVDEREHKGEPCDTVPAMIPELIMSLVETAGSPQSTLSLTDTVPALLEDSEKIEVSLMEGAHEEMLGHVHEENRDLSPIQLSYSKSAVPRKAPSFEDRNDKNEAKEDEVEISGKVELEVMTGHDDDTVEVMESTTADEHERSPPDVAVSNLIDL